MYLCTHKLVISPSDAILNGQHIRAFGYAKQWVVRTMILNGKFRMQKRGVFYLLYYLVICIFIIIYSFVYFIRFPNTSWCMFLFFFCLFLFLNY